MSKLKTLAYALILLAPVTQASAHTLTCDSTSAVTFLAKGSPKALRIQNDPALIPQCNLNLTAGKLDGSVEVVLSEIKTGISMRDHHLKDKYLEIEKFPKAILVLDPVSFEKNPVPTAFTGMLTLHGVQKKISGTISDFKRGANFDTLSGTATSTIQLTDFGIEVPSFAGITVAKDVDLTVKFVGK
jgi:polyisoprenoid-binding protein YceI